MPEEIKYDANATPPQFTNNADMVIEPGTQVRVKIMGTRTEVGEMWAIGSIHGDFLGYATLGQTDPTTSVNPSLQMSSSLGRLNWSILATFLGKAIGKDNRCSAEVYVRLGSGMLLDHETDERGWDETYRHRHKCAYESINVFRLTKADKTRVSGMRSGYRGERSSLLVAAPSSWVR